MNDEVPVFDPANMADAGIGVLARGLPDLPGVFTRQMAVPMAYWEGSECAVVLFFRYNHTTGNPLGTIVNYSRQGDGWTAHADRIGVHWADVIARPRPVARTDGTVFTTQAGTRWPGPARGCPAQVVTGVASRAVTALAVVQEGRETRRALRSHFGAWIVCVEAWAPYRIEALGDTGTVIASIEGAP